MRATASTFIITLLLLALCSQKCSCCIHPNSPNSPCQLCGNKQVEPHEECDDGNNLNNDGCNFECKVQPYFYCKISINNQSVCCNTLQYVIDDKNQCKIFCINGQFIDYDERQCQPRCNFDEYFDSTEKVCMKKEANTRILAQTCSSNISVWDSSVSQCVSICSNGYQLINGTCVLALCQSNFYFNQKINFCQKQCQKSGTIEEIVFNCLQICQNFSISNDSQTDYTIKCLNGTQVKIHKESYWFRCPRQSYLNLDIGLCLKCPNGSMLNSLNTQCVKICRNSSDNQTTNNCTQCSIGSYYNDSLGTCVNICSIHYYFQPSSKSCIYACPETFVINDKGLCICGDNTTLNSTTIRCDPICSNDSILNYTTNTCQKCQNGTVFNSSSNSCSLASLASLSILSFYKIMNQNSFLITASYSMVSARLLVVSQSFQIKLNFPFQNFSVVSYTNNLINLKVSYNQSLNNLEEMTISINNAIVSLPSVTDNNLALKYYSSSQYSAYQIFNSLIPIFTYGVLFLLAITFLFSSKLIAVETFLVFQFTYGGMIMMKKIQATMSPYSQMWPFDGYNILIDDGNQVPPRIQAVNLHANFFSNFNINILFMTLPLFIGFVLFTIHKILKKLKKPSRFQKYAQQFFGEWNLSLMLICIQQLTFAFVINIQYSPTPTAGIIVGTFLILLYIFTAFQFYSKKGVDNSVLSPFFGDFKKFFQSNYTNFYIFAMIYRLSLSLILVFMSESIVSQSLVFVWTSSWLAYLCFKLPYKKSARLIPIINSVIMVLLSIFFLYQRNKADDADINFSTYMPIAVIASLFLTCIFNTIYAGVNFHKTIIHKKKLKAIKKEIDTNKVQEIHIDITQQDTQQNVTQVISENLSNVLAEIHIDQKSNHERPTTALKDLSPIRSVEKDEIIIPCDDISIINERINKTITELIDEDSKSQSNEQQLIR